MVLSDCCELTNFFWILNQTHKFVSNRYIHLNHLNFTNFFPQLILINFDTFTELICDEDVGPMAANLQRIVNNPPPNKVITFRVKTGFEEANDVLDEPNLTGFAQLSLTD